MSMDPRVAAIFSGGDVVIDAGCGDGAPLDALGARYRIAAGFDVSAARVLARSGAPGNWSFSVANLDRGLPLRDGCADAIFANQVIEHVRNPLAFAVEARRVLRPGGLLVVTTPNVRYVKHVWRLIARGEGPMTSSRQPRTSEDWDGGHIHYFTPRDLAWITRAAGFGRWRTSALIETRGALSWLRRGLARTGSAAPVKHFLSGNTLLVATK